MWVQKYSEQNGSIVEVHILLVPVNDCYTAP